MPDHIADANKKAQPAPLPRSAHAFECSLRHPFGKICTCGMGHTAKPAPAPLPGSEDVARGLAEISAAGMDAVAEGLRLYLSDLTRRLGEVEARLEFYQGLAKERHDREVACIARAEDAEDRVRELEAEEEERKAAQDLISDLTRRLAEAGARAEKAEWQWNDCSCALKLQTRIREKAEDRVRELEAEDEERKAGWQLAGDAARGLRVECDGDLGHEAEQIRSERDALREQNGKLERVRAAAVRVANDYADLADSGDCGNWSCEEAVDGYTELRAALAATEVKP